MVSERKETSSNRKFDKSVQHTLLALTV